MLNERMYTGTLSEILNNANHTNACKSTDPSSVIAANASARRELYTFLTSLMLEGAFR